MSSVVFKVNRERVFILATRSTKSLKRICKAIDSKSSLFEHPCLNPCQVTGLMNLQEIHAQANQCWHFRNQPRLCDWLQHSQSDEDEARLHAIGNLVLPRCAHLAMNVLSAATLEADRLESRPGLGPGRCLQHCII